MEAEGCNVPKTGNPPLSTIIYLVFSAVEAVVGMSLNAFIVAVNCINGIKSRHLKSIDKILTALGISRFFYLCILSVKIFWEAIFPWTFEVTNVYQTLKAAIWFLTCTSLCFSACLCSFYCIKIANFQHHIFIRLKMGISKLVPWLLLVSVLGSLVNTSPFFSGIYSITCRKNNNSFDVLGNHSLEGISVQTNLFNLFLYCGTGFSVVFFILTTSTFLLLFSLWRQTHQIQKSLASFSNPSMAAHFQAVKTIMSLLITDVINFVSLMLLLSNIFPEKSPTNQLCIFIVYACPSVQSIILVGGNPKLKRGFSRVMHYIRHMSMF
ncbi:taste receptor type 2 member 40-like [Elgaria multicarinata webbii]|uniref:taste receptor type 2 member 40-like n=1 Tax=Elgaria multicarinata webbii TaxID=159646 RepID=UPI002FCD655D